MTARSHPGGVPEPPAAGDGNAKPGRNDYEERRQGRIERLKRRAENKRREAEGRLRAVDSLASQIPLGQPILVGHHSEARARRDARRIQDGMQRGLETAREADVLERRALAAETNRAISSDDPEAIQKLEEKLKEMVALRDRWIAIRRAMRASDGSLKALALTRREVKTIVQSDWGTAYLVKNASAEARRIKQRIAELREKAQTPPRAPETIGEVVIEEAENRVRLQFPERPGPEVIRELKAHGFRWSRTEQRWQRHATEQAWYWARFIARKVASPPSS